MRTFLRELAVGNGKVACEGLTVSGSASVIATIGPELGNFGINSCAQVVSLTGGQLSAALRRELATVAVGAVALHGSRATVRWSAVRSRFGDVAAYFGHPRALTLSDIRGFWYISRL